MRKARAGFEGTLLIMSEFCLEGLFPAVKAGHFSPPSPKSRVRRH